MTDAEILTALMTRLTSPSLGSPVASPNVTFTPTPNVKHLVAHNVMRAESDQPFLGWSDSVIRRGIFQVDAVIPDGTGEAAGLDLAALVAARFLRGLRLGALQFDFEPAIAAAVKDAPWVRYPVSIRYTLVD